MTGLALSTNQKETSMNLSADSLADTLPWLPFGAVDPNEVEPNWIIEPFIAPGLITGISADPKVGKTTLAMAFAGAAASGSAILGTTARRTRSVYLTEEGTLTFNQKVQRFNIGPDSGYFLSKGKAYSVPWVDRRSLDSGTLERGVISLAVERAKAIGAELLIVDTLAEWAGIREDQENQSGAMLGAFAPLRWAAGEGLAVVVLLQDRKSGGSYGSGVRGSSEIMGRLDVLLSLSRTQAGGRDGARLIRCVGRPDGLPDRIAVKLTGGSYELAEGAKAESPEIQVELALMGGAVTAEEIGLRIGKSLTSVRRILRGLDGIETAGKGTKTDPLRYSLHSVHP